MKEIPLTQGKVALVDDDVHEWASKFRWYALKRPRQSFYAARSSSRDPVTRKQKTIWLHREIMKPGPGEEVDHKFGDTLDNRRREMRNVTRAQNGRGFSKPKENASSRFRGVTWDRARSKWQAKIGGGTGQGYLGRFVSEKDAARAYDKAARELFGEFAQPNFP